MKLNWENQIVWLLFIAIICCDGELCAKFNRHLLQHQCVLSPVGSEGPFYITNQLLRKNIRENKTGVPLRLHLTLTDATRCEPLANVSVDIWQADAIGYYSGFTAYDPNAGPPTTNGSIVHVNPSDNFTFLRGVQITDRNGVVQFYTIYPGGYSTRTNHIHVTVYMGDSRLYTGQLYFPDNINAQIYRLKPYSSRKTPRVKTTDDWLFKRDGGSILTVKTLRGNDMKRGLKSEMIIGIDPNV